ncbi:hypothetical protein [Planctomicrobium sp. SH527]|uniref:hypothetical protein n=1 Tax=Planctomicrobium sp. SH527 TaxID=3448123 RepID=UPI003F5C69B9
MAKPLREHERDKSEDLNADPISGEPGAHPVGTGAGAAVGGALAGKATAESIDPTVETEYWKNEYPNRAYYDQNVTYDSISPAYRYGWESRAANQNRSFDEASQELERDWLTRRGSSKLDWKRAKPAVRDTWDRVDPAMRKLPDKTLKD